MKGGGDVLYHGRWQTFLALEGLDPGRKVGFEGPANLVPRTFSLFKKEKKSWERG